jgi:uncharacterized phage-associated protein
MDIISEVPAAARYAVHTAKALEVIVWLANAKPGIDVYHVVKCAFFADKDHLNRHGRPIAGDDYDADSYGPLGRSIYGLLRRDPIEMLALEGNGQLPFHVRDDAKWAVIPEREANLRLLSASDVAALQRAVAEFSDLSFGELVDITHEDPAYIAAAGGRIRYEDLLDRTDPDYVDKAADLADVARHAVF